MLFAHTPYKSAALRAMLHVALPCLLLFCLSVLCEKPNLHGQDADFQVAAAEVANHEEGNEEEQNIAVGVGIVLALVGFVIFFLVGYYVGRVSTRQTPTYVRAATPVSSQSHATPATTTQPAALTPLPSPPPAPPSATMLVHNISRQPPTPASTPNLLAVHHEALGNTHFDPMDVYRIKTRRE